MSKIPAFDKRIKEIIESRKLDKQLYDELLDEFTHEPMPDEMSMRSKFPLEIEDEHFNKILALRHAFIGNELIAMGYEGKIRDLEDIMYAMTYMENGDRCTFIERLSDFVAMERSEFLPIFYEHDRVSAEGPSVQVYAEDAVAASLQNLGFGGMGGKN